MSALLEIRHSNFSASLKDASANLLIKLSRHLHVEKRDAMTGIGVIKHIHKHSVSQLYSEIPKNYGHDLEEWCTVKGYKYNFSEKVFKEVILFLSIASAFNVNIWCDDFE